MVQFSQCIDCANYLGKNEKGFHFCRAFPTGIPADVFWNEISHKEEVKGDNGIRFEPLDEFQQKSAE